MKGVCVVHTSTEDFLPTFAISLFRTCISGIPVFSLIRVVVVEVQLTTLRVAKVSQKPRRSFLDRLVAFVANFSSKTSSP